MSPKSIVITLVLLSLFIIPSLGQCPNQCSHRGKCDPISGKCQCNNGFYTEDCSKSPYELAYGGWMSLRIVTSILYFSLMFFSAFVLFVRRSRGVDVQSVTTLGFFNAHTVVLSLVFIICLDVGLQFAIDPSAFKFIFPFPLFRYMFGIVFPLMSTLYCVILFLWVSVYDTTMKTLTREDAIRKINANYTKETSLEEIIEQTGKLQGVVHRFKMVIVALNVGAWIYQLVREALISSKQVTTKSPFLQPMWLAYFGLVYLVETVGFFYYSPKLLGIMPEQLRKKMLRVTRIIRIQAISFMMCWVVIVVILSNKAVNAQLYTLTEWIYRMIVFIILVIIMSLFVRFQKAFPFIRVRDSGRSKKSSQSDNISTKGNSHSASHNTTADIELSFQ